MKNRPTMPTATTSYTLFHVWKWISSNTRTYAGTFWGRTPANAATEARKVLGHGKFQVRARKGGGILLAAA